MSDPAKYPKFIWVVVALILVAIVGYALRSGQPVHEIEFPGGGVKFGPKPKEETVRFYVSYERTGTLVIEGQAVLYLSGADPVTLSVDQAKPFQTASTSVPKPGPYAYRLEQVETHRYQTGGEDALVRVAMQGDGKIDVQPGVAFQIRRVLDLDAKGSLEKRWVTRLESVHSEEERRLIRERAMEELDKIMDETP